MAHSFCTEPLQVELEQRERDALLRIARTAIQHRLAGKAELALKDGQLRGRLAERRASFVSVYSAAQLRGCVGNLAGTTALGRDVARNAVLAATGDPRFEPLGDSELTRTRIEISVLSSPVDIEIHSESELYQELVPYEDGVVLEGANMRATFLPKVWEKLPKPQDFVRELKRKAGLPADFWCESLHFARYRALSFSDA
jgi:AmmeMemoRadiSam system protein A